MATVLTLKITEEVLKEKAATKEKNLNVRIDPELHEAFTRLCEKRFKALPSAILRSLVIELCRQYRAVK